MLLYSLRDRNVMNNLFSYPFFNSNKGPFPQFLNKNSNRSCTYPETTKTGNIGNPDNRVQISITTARRCTDLVRFSHVDFSQS